MGFGFKGKDGFNILDFKHAGFILPVGGKLFNDRAFGQKNNYPYMPKRNVIRIFHGGFFNQLKEGRLLFFTVNNENSVEYFVPAMLRIYLRKTENLTVGKFPAQLLAKVVEVLYLFRIQGQSFFFIVFGNIFNFSELALVSGRY